MTTWHHYPFSHPWMSARKRKLSDSPDDSDHDCAPAQPYASRILPQSKRRRFDLARNLSRLSLFEQAQTPVQAPIIEEKTVFQGCPPPPQVLDEEVNISPWLPPNPQGASEDTIMDMDGDIPVIQPIIEEATEHPITMPEIRMRHSSSYEPEKDRIVVTDLDSSEDEAETPSESSSDNKYSVSHALLSRINSTALVNDIPPIPESDPSQALVLFKPSPWSAKDPRELEGIYRTRDEENRHTDRTVPKIEEPNTDAMEIE